MPGGAAGGKPICGRVNTEERVTRSCAANEAVSSPEPRKGPKLRGCVCQAPPAALRMLVPLRIAEALAKRVQPRRGVANPG